MLIAEKKGSYLLEMARIFSVEVRGRQVSMNLGKAMKRGSKWVHNTKHTREEEEGGYETRNAYSHRKRSTSMGDRQTPYREATQKAATTLLGIPIGWKDTRRKERKPPPGV